MCMKNPDSWWFRGLHVFRPRTDLEVASIKRMLKDMSSETDVPATEPWIIRAIEFPHKMVSMYGVLYDTAEDLSKHSKCPCIDLTAGWDEDFQYYIYLRFADVPNGRYTQGLKGGREQKAGRECSPDFALISESIPSRSPGDELLTIWNTSSPMEILDRLNGEYGVYLGGKDYREFAKEKCKEIAAFRRGSIYRFPAKAGKDGSSV